jgi:hypothetical protein
MILLSRPYDAYLSGTIVQLQTSVETALAAQGFGTLSAGPVTAGAVNIGSQFAGRCGVAVAGSSVTISSPLITTETKINAVIAQAAADTTATFVARVLCANGSAVIYLNAAATGIVAIDWYVVNPSGLTPKN